MTVDDGKGEPTTYTLDEKDDPKAGDLKADGLDGSQPPVDRRQRLGDPARQGRRIPADEGPRAGQPRPGLHAGRGGPGAGGGGFSTPGGQDFAGDFGGGGGGSVGAEPAMATAGGGDAGVGAGGSADATSTAGASDFGRPSRVRDRGLRRRRVARPGRPDGGSDTSLPIADGGGLGATPVDSGMHQAAASSGGGMSGMGGMGMMGGMGGAPGGGDQQRGPSQYRIEGSVFETSGAKGRISGSLDDEGERSIRYDR